MNFLSTFPAGSRSSLFRVLLPFAWGVLYAPLASAQQPSAQAAPLLRLLPRPLLGHGPGDLLWWQWLALPMLVLLAWVVGRIASRVSSWGLGRIAKTSATAWDDEWIARTGAPLAMAWMAGAFYLLVPVLDAAGPAQTWLVKAVHTALYLAFFWAVLRTLDVTAVALTQSAWAKGLPASRTIVPLGIRAGKVAVVVLAVVAMLAQLGYPVASLVAGLGIGGLAFALAAQKTVENLFGAFSISVDQPFREGDFIGVDGVLGTVETIGLRSTRIRTLDRTVVAIPNGKLAEMRIESFAVRDRIRLACTVSLVYETTTAQMLEVLRGAEEVLRAHPKIWPDQVVVRFKEFAASSLDIEVMAWFSTQDFAEFQLIRQEVLLGLMGVVEKAGTAFAFPTRTLHVESGKAGAQGRPASA